ncbi:PREDICTED: uncharacterized protein LOC109243874 [Nicotiana attenuata]|uniref:uncharacterized protein LOC109243874 n=1 Tax=Nicotiana attenuata TaxID=49451 RepID=UPI000905AC2F|nr:PREDICTED: uncharacterized protein LOC109243874 [Nicotiana attenuata]
MPKFKRFRNPLKSARQPNEAHVHFSSSAIPLQSPCFLVKDSDNATKQIRVKVNEVNNLTIGERIIVDFDEYNTAYCEAQGLLAGYCGTLAIDCNLFPISIEKWSGPSLMPKKSMEDCCETILKELCRRNKENQKKEKMPHTGGSKAISRRRHELFLVTEKTPSRGKIFIETHKRSNGSYVNDAAKTIGEEIELNMTQYDTNECEVSPNDVICKMLGAEHSRRLRCMGMGVVL